MIVISAGNFLKAIDTAKNAGGKNEKDSLSGSAELRAAMLNILHITLIHTR